MTALLVLEDGRIFRGEAYGALGTVTRTRVEVVSEGTEEGTEDAPPPEGRWLAYEFKGKPGDVRRRPRQFAPYHLRLDWLMWFLPLGRTYEDWFAAFLGRLLDADPAVLQLLAHDPFAGEKPAFVRALSYRYRFATRDEHRRDGVRWVRDRRRTVVPALRGTGAARMER